MFSSSLDRAPASSSASTASSALTTSTSAAAVSAETAGTLADGGDDGWPAIPPELSSTLVPAVVGDVSSVALIASPSVANGVIVTNVGGTWTAYDSDLAEVWTRTVEAEPTFSWEDESSPWVGVPIALPWPNTVFYGDVVDLGTGRTFEVPEFENFAFNQGDPPRARVLLTRYLGGETQLFDLSDGSYWPLTETTYRAVLSPDGALYAIVGELGERGPSTIVIGPAGASAIDPIWEYRAPDGVAFADAGQFDDDGSLVLNARATSSSEVFSYVGEPGGSLRLLSPAEYWERIHPGTPIGWVDGGPALVLVDGTHFSVRPGGEHEPICRRTGSRVLLTDDQILTLDHDYSKVAERLDWTGGRSIAVRSYGDFDILLEDGYELEAFVACHDLTLRSLEGLRSGIQEWTSDVFVTSLEDRIGHQLLWFAGDQFFLSEYYDVIQSLTISPDGEKLVFTAVRAGVVSLVVLDVASGEVTASIGLPEVRSVTWLYG